MVRKLPKSLVLTDFPSLWRNSRRFIAQGLRLTTPAKHSIHFMGGQAPHKGSKCPQCKKRLTLMWDLDLRDKLIGDRVRDGFAPAMRLPFFICWQCMAAAYIVSSDSRIQCFPFGELTEYLKDGETPFESAPIELPRRPISFERIPSTIDGLLTLEDTVGIDELDQEAKNALRKYYGSNLNSSWDLPISQFGGQPLPYQGHQTVICPNPRCPASKVDSYGALEIPFLMKEMALIHWQDEPILEEHCFQLLYSVCGICFSIRAEYRCD